MLLYQAADRSRPLLCTCAPSMYSTWLQYSQCKCKSGDTFTNVFGHDQNGSDCSAWFCAVLIPPLVYCSALV